MIPGGVCPLEAMLEQERIDQIRQWKKRIQLALPSFMSSAAPKASGKLSSLAEIATRIATFSYSLPQFRRR